MTDKTEAVASGMLDAIGNRNNLSDEQWLVTVAQAAIEAYDLWLAENAWQDISTAPNDGRMIWTYNKLCSTEPKLRPADGGFWRYEIEHGSKVMPMIWCEQHIPAPPAQESDK